MTTKIEWTEETWNPVTGCTPVSEGCEHCYARRMAQRMAGRFGYDAEHPFAPSALREDVLQKPHRWKKPRMIFVISMGDLFHQHFLRSKATDRIFDVMEDTPRHTYQVLTKRSHIMAGYLARRYPDGVPPHIWIGVTAENQRCANERIPDLLSTRAAVRFVSVEPMLGPVSIADAAGVTYWDDPVAGIHWVICGGETGPGARVMLQRWAQDLCDEAVNAGIRFFFKQWGTGGERRGRLLYGREWSEYPTRKEGRC